ncbi:DUF2382 domain-containing protein [Pseudokineococcus sp. 5B2Z-1]|uniref:DUF2382 domain-containing protein n=1 Tax=Pseudokineococcus sp. 5B2Z-1 TaxID=3132744 RepID=UPI003095CE8B
MTATVEDEGRPRSSGASARPAAEAAEVVVAEERAVARRLRVPVERVRVAKRIRTETVRVEVDVEVRREELVVTSAPVPPEEGERLAAPVEDGPGAGGGAPAEERVVLVLSEEVPVVGVETRAAERVSVAVRRVEGVERVVVDLDREVVDVEGARAAPAATSTTDQQD